MDPFCVIFFWTHRTDSDMRVVTIHRGPPRHGARRLRPERPAQEVLRVPGLGEPPNSPLSHGKPCTLRLSTDPRGAVTPASSTHTTHALLGCLPGSSGTPRFRTRRRLGSPSRGRSHNPPQPYSSPPLAYGNAAARASATRWRESARARTASFCCSLAGVVSGAGADSLAIIHSRRRRRCSVRVNAVNDQPVRCIVRRDALTT
jgi:hypothetical protein